MRLLGGAGLALLAALLGAAVAVGAVALHQWWWGLVLAWVAAVAGLLALPRRWTARPAYAAGFTGLVWEAATPGPGGGHLVGGGLTGYGLLGLVPALIVVALVTMPARRRRPCDDDRGNAGGSAYGLSRD